jgi:hypothetical protein
MLTRAQQTFYAQLPDWARPTNAVLRYMLQRGQLMRSRSLRMVAWVVGAGIASALLAISWGAYEADSPLVMAEATESRLFTVLYFPLLILQFIALMLALLSVSGTVAVERQRGTWEAFKITSHGAELVMRARWAAVFYQMRWLLALLIIPRVLFAILMLDDLTLHNGYHLDLYVTGITPDVPLEVAVIMLAALMTATLLQLFVLLGLNAAIGLLISALFNNRTATMAARAVVFAVEIGLFALALRLGAGVLDADPLAFVTQDVSMMGNWIKLLLMGTLGDQGLRFMDLRTFLRAWTDVEYGIFLGGALLVAVLVQIALTNALINFAARWASRPQEG